MLVSGTEQERKLKVCEWALGQVYPMRVTIQSELQSLTVDLCSEIKELEEAIPFILTPLQIKSHTTVGHTFST